MRSQQPAAPAARQAHPHVTPEDPGDLDQQVAAPGVWSYPQIRMLLAVRAVPDILSQGGGRETGPWPRRVVAAAVLVLVAVTIVHYLPRSRHGTVRPVRAAVSAAPLPTAVSGDVGVAAEPDGITGQVSSWPGGLRLPATGERPAWFWPATGRMAPIGGLPRNPLATSSSARRAAGRCRPVRLFRPAVAFALDRDVPSTSWPIMRRR